MSFLCLTFITSQKCFVVRYFRFVAGHVGVQGKIDARKSWGML